MKKRAVVAASDDRYAKWCLIALGCFRFHNPGYDAFLLGRFFSAKTQARAENLGVSLILVNPQLQRSFSGNKMRYPLECFAHFLTPQVLPFHYTRAVVLDGDILTCRPLPRKMHVPFVAAARVGNATLRSIFPPAHIGRLMRTFNIPAQRFQHQRCNTGVLFLNLPALRQIQYTQTVIRLFRRAATAKAPRGGDDSLFSLFHLTHPQFVKKLHPRFNYFRPGLKIPRTKVVFFHFTGHFKKPWDKTTRQPRHYRQKWQTHRKRILGALGAPEESVGLGRGGRRR